MTHDELETVMKVIHRINEGESIPDAAKALGLTRDELLELVDLL